jgi:hypothetical protein
MSRGKKAPTASSHSTTNQTTTSEGSTLRDLIEFLKTMDPKDFKKFESTTTLLTQRAFADGHSAEEVALAISTAATANPKIDGRTLRKTNRTVALSLRVTPEFDTLLRETARSKGILLAEVLERGLALYTQKHATRRKTLAEHISDAEAELIEKELAARSQNK